MKVNIIIHGTITLLSEWSPYFFYVGNAIQGVSGGIMAFFCAASSYITDVTEPQNRALRIYIMEGAFFISMGLIFMAMGESAVRPTWVYL